MGYCERPSSGDNLRDLLCLFHHIHFDSHRVHHCGHGIYQIKHCGCRFCGTEVQHAINLSEIVLRPHLPTVSTLHKFTFLELCPRCNGWYHIASEKTIIEDLQIRDVLQVITGSRAG